jgi:MoaA/NifB/PqqE/SkfB family radical SAM enzyme
MPSFRLLCNECARALLSPITLGKASEYIQPTIAAIYITKYCNSRCTMCNFWKNKRDPNELNSEQWGVIFSRLKAFGVDFVGVNASGEMFTKQDVFEILEHLRNLHLNFGVNSNGTLLVPDNAKRLAQLNPRAVTIGLDGLGDDAYVATRGLKDGFTLVCDNIKALQQAGISNIGLGTVLMKRNMRDWVDLARFAHEKGLSGIRYTAHHDAYFTSEQNEEGKFSLSQDTLSSMEDEIEKIILFKRKTGIVKNSETYLRWIIDFYRQPRAYFPLPCLQGSNRIEIDVYGNVTLCSFMTKPLGNLVRQEMEDIWNSALHQQARADAYRGNCPKCFLSCYAEENIRLSTKGFLPTLANSIKRGVQLLGPRK